MGRPKLAIVGTGIAGLGAAFKLRDRYRITFFESNSYIGGHSNTVSFDGVKFDTGFMVFNRVTYPKLIKLFESLHVEMIPALVSFGVQNRSEKIEYGNQALNSFFAQRKRLFTPRFYKLLLEISRFNKEASENLNSYDDDFSLGQFLLSKKFSSDLLGLYVVPMTATIWSAPFDLMLNFPARTVFKFLSNHGFLGNSQHQWYTLKGGSINYVQRLSTKTRSEIRLNSHVMKVMRNTQGAKISFLDQYGRKQEEQYAKVILAAHADQSLEMIDNPTIQEQRFLGSFEYSHNPTYIHTDESVMPKNKRAWSSLNYSFNSPDETCVHYWMNSLQSLKSKKQYFVTLDSRLDHGIDQKLILKTIDYRHPLIDSLSVKAQKELHLLNMQGPLYFCGSYFGYGFHEDALRSGETLAELLLSHKVIEAKTELESHL